MEALSTMAIIGMENATQTLISSLGWHFYFQKGSWYWRVPWLDHWVW